MKLTKRYLGLKVTVDVYIVRSKVRRGGEASAPRFEKYLKVCGRFMDILCSTQRVNRKIIRIKMIQNSDLPFQHCWFTATG